LDGSGAASAIHPLVGGDVNDGTACPQPGDGGVPSVDDSTDGGVTTPGILGDASSLAFDAARRMLWIAHAGSADLVAVGVDDSPTPRTLSLPAGAPPAVQLAVVDATLFAFGADGSLSTVDLLAATPRAVAQPPLMLSGLVTAVGSDGEWLYVADGGARVWRIDPLDLSAAPTQLLGDGAHGLVVGDQPGVNEVAGIGYDGARGVLLVSDRVENSLLAVQ
ncbi:MAG: hypothetical protein LC659_07220, partial [Myxococcales bacterium]|nr:hypothetical protein [Myxococcales bacterium]